MKSGYFGKRAFDLFLSAVFLLVLFPVFLITALCIKLEDGGPVFYRQERCTKHGRVFEILKFRSMVGISSLKDGRTVPPPPAQCPGHRPKAFSGAKGVLQNMLGIIIRGHMTPTGFWAELRPVSPMWRHIAGFATRTMCSGLLPMSFSLFICSCDSGAAFGFFPA